jgi:hypothetical protein
MIKLGTIETFNAVHLSLLSLSLLGAFSCLCEQVIIIVLRENNAA